jgi:pyridoxal phosphate enzyme (YggS family)
MSIAKNLDKVKTAIYKAEAASSRPSGSVKLLAVSKFHDVSAVLEAMGAGQFLFGENRVQEAVEKFTRVKEAAQSAPLLHIIGSLQRNKVKQALSIASCVQSIDRLELLDEIEKQAQKTDAKIKVLFEIHTGEQSKSGFVSIDELSRCIDRASRMRCVECEGFMTMAPFTDDERVIRNSFASCRKVAENMQKQFPSLRLTELSMGMSNDFSIAIEEGSTMVRIGTAIFGERA